MVSVNDDGKGNYYLRQNGDVITRLPSDEQHPSIFKPQLHQDKAENVLESIPDSAVDVLIADPPYGIEFESNRYKAANLEIRGFHPIEFSPHKNWWRVIYSQSVHFMFQLHP